MRRHSTKTQIKHHISSQMMVFQTLWLRNNEKRKDEIQCKCETRIHKMITLTSPSWIPQLGPFHSSFHWYFQSSFVQFLSQFLQYGWISWRKFLIQFCPFSFGPGTSPTASTRFVHKLRGFKLFVKPSAGLSSPRQWVRDSFLLRYRC